MVGKDKTSVENLVFAHSLLRESHKSTQRPWLKEMKYNQEPGEDLEILDIQH